MFKPVSMVHIELLDLGRACPTARESVFNDKDIGVVFLSNIRDGCSPIHGEVPERFIGGNVTAVHDML